MQEQENKQRQLELVKKAKAGDMLAFEDLIVQYEKMIYNVALRMMNHSEDAYDMAQEVFIKAYRYLDKFDERSAFSTWLYRIAVNTCIDEMRKRKGKQTQSLDNELQNEDGSWKQEIADPDATPEEAVLQKEEQSEIMQALDTLSEEHKTIVVLRDIRGLSYEEIAEITETSLGTVKSRLSRGRKQLQQEILKIWEQNGKTYVINKERRGRT
ncbi:sigma-70 family RNA polymerase sigma factor [Chakrabartyella piscis]|uniref:sigma-70 family RNA polymerase sigma factor n=1 Tax=Chakrabartyella piscis TaxID=2918914 RepID=UPI002958AA65|nr:sigma-70 family RNA polymerase sigma factor [Chakrabartyella piscis]